MLSCHSDDVPTPRMTFFDRECLVKQTPSFPSLSIHLRSNVVPHLSSPVADAQHTLQHNAREIEHLRAAIHALEAEQATIARYVAESQSLLTPIRKLPVEILGEIFAIHCARGTGNIVGERPYYPALRVSQVCYFWRQVMLSRTELWAKLEVRLDQMTKGSLELLKLFLEHSKASPLTLRVTSGYWNSSVDSHSTLPWNALQLLLENAHRWFSATLRLDYQLFLRASSKVAQALEQQDVKHNSETSSIHSPFSRLEHLDISWFDCRISSVYSDRPAIRLFENASSLRSLTIPHYDDCFVFPLSNVHTFKLTNVHRNPTSILPQCTNLTKLSILNFAIRDSGLVASRPQVSNITHLDIQLSSYFETLTLKNLFDHLELPCLTSLTVSEPFHRYVNRRTWSQEAFVSLQSRSGFQLQKLGIMEVPITGEDLVEVLTLNPFLRELTFFEWHLRSATKKLLEALVSSSSTAETVVPGLKHLRVRSDEALVDIGRVVESRLLSSSGPLEEVLLFGGQIGCMDLNVICAHGTRIVVRHEPTLSERVYQPRRKG
ncbi:hypothetical protein E1B28_012851 [Marasmius oreades]|uniref:F-box domain-containing protein n=1 Tax=Marasmius oreades TaxID=181124 RepID=A0A9P7UQD7_9AGAR|nr:uncharacterized protein E1B28_012851 [Marasmius oreades]KAG7088906.1 hypothetical protein E1B28_012851 [Marasmius oreades]